MLCGPASRRTRSERGDLLVVDSQWLRRISIALPLCLVVLLVDSSPLLGQQDAGGLFGTDERFSLSYDRLEADISTEGGGRSLVVLGNVVFEGQGYSLRADAIGIFIDGVDAVTGPINPRVLAIGEVLLTRDKQSFRAETIFLDVTKREMVLSEARLRISQQLIERLRMIPRDDPLRSRMVAESWVAGVSDVTEEGHDPSWIGIEARHLEVSDFRDVEGRGITFTTDEFFDPEWALVAERARAVTRKEIDQRADEDLPGGYLIEVEDARLEVAGVPVVPLPSTTWDSRWGRSFPVRDLRVSDSSKYGTRIDTAWNGDLLLSKRFEEEIDLTPRFDHLSERGTGVGLDFEMGRDPLRWAEKPDGRLELFGYGSIWGIEDEAIADSDGTPIASPDRSRSRAFFHARFGPGTMIDGELASSSDAGFIEEYFRSEARTLKAPENFLAIRQVMGEDLSASLLTRVRGSDHLEVLEKKPEFTLRAIDRELVGGLRWDSDLIFDDQKWRPAEGSLDPEVEVHRTDWRTELTLPMGLSRWIRMVPGAGVRYTSWDGPDFDPVDRTQYQAGLQLATRLSRVFDVENRQWQIDGLRHVIDFTAGYSSLFDSSLDAASVPTSLDATDTLTDLDQVQFSLVQRLQTRDFRTDREKVHRLGTRTVAEARIDAYYYPEAERDHGGEEWGILNSELVLHGEDGWSLFGETTHDVGTGVPVERNGGVRWLDMERGLLELAWRERPDVHRTILVGGRTSTSDRWDMGVFVEYDALTEEAIGQWWEVGRNFRTFRMLFSLDVEQGDVDETTLRIDIGLRDMMNAMRGRRSGAYGPGRIR